MSDYILERKRDGARVQVDSLAKFRRKDTDPDGSGKSFEEAGFEVVEVYSEPDRTYVPYEAPERQQPAHRAEEKKPS